MRIPQGCTVNFAGGCIKNGIVVFEETTLTGNISFKECHFKGRLTNTEFNVVSYGADKTRQKDNTTLINELVQLETSNNNKGKVIFFPAGEYRIDSPIILMTNYDQPVEIIGVGPGSVLIQYSDNNYIFKIYERQNIRDITLKYHKFQDNNQRKSIAIACKRSLMSQFSNIYIEGCHTAIGFLEKEDWDSEIGESSAIVNNTFSNIRLSSYSGYFINTIDRVNGGDSGSIFNNIYISNSKNPVGQNSLGAICFGTSTATFNQLNLENTRPSSKSQIFCAPYASISISLLHIEGQKHLDIPIISARNFSQVSVDLMQVEFCAFPKGYWTALDAAGQSFIGVRSVTFRDLDEKPTIKIGEPYNRSKIIVDNIIDTKGYVIQ